MCLIIFPHKSLLIIFHSSQFPNNRTKSRQVQYVAASYTSSRRKLFSVVVSNLARREKHSSLRYCSTHVPPSYISSRCRCWYFFRLLSTIFSSHKHTITHSTLLCAIKWVDDWTMKIFPLFVTFLCWYNLEWVFFRWNEQSLIKESKVVRGRITKLSNMLCAYLQLTGEGRKKKIFLRGKV